MSGVILFEETLFQTLDNGKSVAQQLKDKGIYIGIKVL